MVMVFVEKGANNSQASIRLAEGEVPAGTFTSVSLMDNGHPNIIIWLMGKPQSEEAKAKVEQAVADFVQQLMSRYWK